jgi:hypothetical protein
MKTLSLLAASFLVLAAFSSCSRAAPGCGKHVVFGTTDETGRKIELILDSAVMQRTPAWNPQKGEPPLSVSKASRAALMWAKTKYTRYDSVEISELMLTSYSCHRVRDRWYYRFQFSPIIDGNRVSGWGNFVAVLMDGSVVAPVASQ